MKRTRRARTEEVNSRSSKRPASQKRARPELRQVRAGLLLAGKRMITYQSLPCQGVH